MAAIQALPKNSVGTKQLKKNAVNSAKVKNRSLLAVDFKAGQLPRGAKGDKGDPGAPGTPGAPGAPGQQGPPGPVTGDLPSGVTLRGKWGAEGRAADSNSYTGGSVSFVLRPSASPTRHFIPNGAAPPPECPGTVLNPQAAAGHLCVFEGANKANVETPAAVIFDANSGSGRYGFDFEVFALAGPGNYWTYGTWAVTAPVGAGPANPDTAPAPSGPAGTASGR